MLAMLPVSCFVKVRKRQSFADEPGEHEARTEVIGRSSIGDQHARLGVESGEQRF
jgi:hypothetical protein